LPILSYHISKYIHLLAFLLATYIGLAQQTTNSVKYRNGVIVSHPMIEIIDFGKPTSYLLLGKSQQVSMDQVSSFEINGTYYMVKDLSGFGTVVLRRDIEGTISVYSTVLEQFRETAILGGNEQSKLQFYLLDNELKRLNYQNLRVDFAEHSEYSHRIESSRKKTLLRTSAIVTGLALTGVGLARMFEPVPDGTYSKLVFKPNSTFVAGGLLTIGAIAFGRKKDSMESMITDYNKEFPVKPPD
jgi:hypothetical protein